MSHYFVEDVAVSTFCLSPEESKHIVKAMRKQVGDTVTITDGKGKVGSATIMDNHKGKVMLQIESWEDDTLQRTRFLHLAVAPTKNPDRMEWLVEKGVELGIEKISFIITDHSERKHLDLARMKRLAIAALKQSGGSTLPEIELTTFQEVVNTYRNDNTIHKWFGHCNFEENNIIISKKENLHNRFVVLIGPEGDFSTHEISTALAAQYEPIKLGTKVLRTETAALVVVSTIALF